MYLLLLVLCLLGRFKCMALPLFSLLSLFFQLSITVTVSHHPIQHHLSWLPLVFFLVFFLVIFTLITVISSDSSVSMCLFLIVCIRALSSSIIASILFVICSVQLIFSILL